MREIEPSKVPYEVFFHCKNDYLQILAFTHAPTLEIQTSEFALTLFEERNLTF